MSATPPPPPPVQPPPPSQAPVPSGYPATLTFDAPDKIARWRIIGNIILAIPHFILLYVLGIVAAILVFVAWILGVVTGKVPEGLQGFIALYLRYSTRVGLFALFLTEDYPPFAFGTEFADPGDYPRLRVDFTPDLGNRSRLTIFFRGLLAIPHYIVLFFVFIALYFVLIIGWFAVLILGRWPEGLRNFLIGYQRWNLRLSAYVYLLTDEYPPFGFE